MNLLHDIPAGSADEMNVIIEIPRFSKNKYEIDKETKTDYWAKAIAKEKTYLCLHHRLTSRPCGQRIPF